MRNTNYSLLPGYVQYLLYVSFNNIFKFIDLLIIKELTLVLGKGFLLSCVLLRMIKNDWGKREVFLFSSILRDPRNFKIDSLKNTEF